MFYGGRLLSHLSYEIECEESINEFIDLAKINRKACIILDSDRSSEKEDLNLTKQRIIEEFSQNDQFHIVTAGREIENYIPENSLNEALKEVHPDVSKSKTIKWSQYGSLTSIDDSKAKYFNKVAVAKAVTAGIKSLEDYELSLTKTISSLVNQINKANGY